MCRISKWKALQIAGLIALVTVLLPFGSAQAAGEEDLFITVKPNVLFILDNSNSMDEDDSGNAVGSFSSQSRSVIGRKAAQEVIERYVNYMRIGLMTYRLPSVSAYYLHNSAYFASYEPKSYCPSDDEAVLTACQNYCNDPTDTTSRDTCQAGCRDAGNTLFDATYSVEGISGNPSSGDSIIRDSTGAKRAKYCALVYPKTKRGTNPTDTARFIYYKQALPYYASSSGGNQFFWATSYSADESTTPGVPTPGVTYYGWRKKTGTEDTHTNYSDYIWNNFQFSPTDSDLALGYGNFGRRMTAYNVGQTWYANSSPGGGYRHIECKDYPATSTHKADLLAKLDTKEGDETGYMTCATAGNACAHVVNAGLTPMPGTLRSAKNYFLGEKDYKSGVGNTSPIQDWCQKNFIVYVTDGLPSTDENGNAGSAADLIEAAKTRIQEMRDVTFKIVKDYNFDIQTYVIGLSLTDEAQPYLDALAVAGGTAVDGKAYYANDLDELKAALNKVFDSIMNRSFSFSTASVSASRVKDENYLYEASFLPYPESLMEPFWLGYLRQFTIEEDGSVALSYNWDAGTVLQARTSSRTIWTLKSGAKTDFNTTNITATDLTVADDTHRDLVVNFIRNGELDTSYVHKGWKLGDIFHSSPRTIGTPSYDYTDQVEIITVANPTRAFETFRSNHLRTTTEGTGFGKRIVVIGANDGQMHAFRTTDGAEVWSFIPPNLLPNLKKIAHDTHSPIPSGLEHTPFVDGPVSASDVWLPVTASNGKDKDAADWYTYMVFALRQGGSNTLWSSSSTCESGFSSTYSATNPYYCGYYALDITDTLNPAYKWGIQGKTLTGLSSTDGPYFGEPWSRMGIGRVQNASGHEIWVGFIGGGYSGIEHKPPAVSNTIGKGFFVIDMKTGNILWRFTYANDTGMTNDLAGPPAIVDTNNDGFIDTVYAGDLGGNMWRFRFDYNAATASVSWTGKKLFNASSTVKGPIYTSPTVAKDKAGNLWVYFGTGDIMDPTKATAVDYFFAIKDNDRDTTWTASDLTTLSSESSVYDPTDNGWVITLNTGSGEKMLADPTVFRGVVYFTTYVPDQASTLCNKTGDAYLYAVDYVTGKGKFLDNDDNSIRKEKIGDGVPTSPIVSLNPYGGTDVYASTSSSDGESHTKKLETPDIANLNRTNLMFWRDLRLNTE